MFTGLIDSV